MRKENDGLRTQLDQIDAERKERERIGAEMRERVAQQRMPRYLGPPEEEEGTT
jgi:hypothetical protein